MAIRSTTTGKTKRPRAKYILNIDRIEQLTSDEKKKLKEVGERYAFRANDYYLSLIDWDDPNDPIKQLVIPQERELEEWGKLDASNEQAITVAPRRAAQIWHDRASIGQRSLRCLLPLLFPQTTFYE